MDQGVGRTDPDASAEWSFGRNSTGYACNFLSGDVSFQVVGFTSPLHAVRSYVLRMADSLQYGNCTPAQVELADRAVGSRYALPLSGNGVLDVVGFSGRDELDLQGHASLQHVNCPPHVTLLGDLARHGDHLCALRGFGIRGFLYLVLKVKALSVSYTHLRAHETDSYL